MLWHSDNERFDELGEMGAVGGGAVVIDGELASPGDYGDYGDYAETETEAGAEVDLGPCCSCGGKEGVRNVMMLHKKQMTPGKGWGCFLCGLPMEGAVAVLCDPCFDEGKPLRCACDGYPADGVRVPIESLTEVHEHDMSQHPEAWVCAGCGCTEAAACPGGCYWVAPNLCSRCEDAAPLREV